MQPSTLYSRLLTVPNAIVADVCRSRAEAEAILVLARTAAALDAALTALQAAAKQRTVVRASLATPAVGSRAPLFALIPVLRSLGAACVAPNGAGWGS